MHQAIKNLQEAIAHEDPKAEKKLIKLIETDYLKGFKKHIKYLVVLQSFDVMDKWKGVVYDYEVLRENEIFK